MRYIRPRNRRRPPVTFVAAIMLAGVLAACQGTPDVRPEHSPPAPTQSLTNAPPAAAPVAQPTTLEATTLPSDKPILEPWTDGIYLLRTGPSPEFALWADGTTVQHVNRRWYTGHLRPEEVQAVMRQVKEAGLFNPPFFASHAVPDGGSKTLAARDGDRQVQLTYGGIYDGAGALEQIGPNALPSRADVTAFLRRWHGPINAINQVAPERLDRLGRDPPLKYPTTQQK